MQTLDKYDGFVCFFLQASYYIYIHAGIKVHKISVHIIANPFHIFNSILYHAMPYISYFLALRYHDAYGIKIVENPTTYQ